MERRTFMQTVVAASVFSALPAAVKDKRVRENGRSLLFDSSQLESLRGYWQLPLFSEYVREVLSADIVGDKNFLLKELDFNNHIRHIARANKILTRESFIWLMTGDPERLNLAKLALKKILAYPAWDYFLEAGQEVIGLQRAPETTIAVSLAFDWLYFKLDDKIKQQILDQLGPKGCEPCFRTLWGLRYPDKVKGWGFAPAAKLEPRDFSRWPIILDKTNLKAIPLCGLTIGAATLMGVHSQTDAWFEMAQYSYETLAQLYCLDGSYPEGGSYGDYTTLHMLLTQALFKRKRNIDLFDRVNYNGFIDFMMGLEMPQHATIDERVNHENRAKINSGDMPQRKDQTVNFGDAGGGLQSGVGFYVARETRDGLAQHIALNHYREHNPFSIIWYDPTVTPEAPEASEHFKHFDLDWIVYRSGYRADDWLVAMRSGPPANHEHADRNSLLFAAYNDILLADVKHPTYDHFHPGWMLRQSPGHNTVLVDGHGHQYHDGREGTNSSLAHAKIIRQGRRKNLVHWTSDATPAYALVNPDIRQILRTVFVIPEIPLLMVVDRMEKKENDSIFSNRWHIENSDQGGNVRLHQTGFVVERPRARFYAVYDHAHELIIHQENMPIPAEFGTYPYVQADSKNAARQATLIMVGMPLHLDQPDPSITISADGMIRLVAMGKTYSWQLRQVGRFPYLQRTA